MTLWELLGVPKTCTDEELKTAYRKKCLELHPDRTGNDPNKTKLFISMKDVYEKVVKRREEERRYRPQQADPGIYTSDFGSTIHFTFFNSEGNQKAWDDMMA